MAVVPGLTATAQTALGSTATSLAVTLPTDASVGKTLLAWVAQQTPSTAGTDIAVTGPTGWTQVQVGAFDPTTAGAVGSKLTAWRRLVASGDATTATWTWDVGANTLIAVTTYAGVNTTTPVVESAFANKTDSNAARVGPTITTAGSRLISSAFADRSGSTYSAFTDTQRAQLALTSSTSLFVQDTNVEVVAGTYTKSATASVATAVATMGVVALQAGTNAAPTVSAGPDQTVVAGSTVTLTGTATDSDGTIATRVWAQDFGPANPTITQATNATTATVTLTTPGRYQYKFTATDNAGGTTTDFVAIFVTSSTARPDLDVASSGTWTLAGGATTVSGALADESTTTYVQSPGTAGSFNEVRIGPLSAGAPTITYGLSSDTAGSPAPGTVELRMGSTVIASWSEAPTTTTETTVTRTLTATQLAAVTGRTDLRLRFVDA